MLKLVQSLFLSIFLITSLGPTLEAGIIKNTAKKTTILGATKVAKSTGKTAIKSQVKKKALQSIHKNSKTYKGDSHVYAITNSKGLYKIGESSQGKNDKGLSKRAESQVAKLQQETGDKSYKSEIRKEFSSKAEARAYETKLIERTRNLYGTDKNDKSILPGNKTNG